MCTVHGALGTEHHQELTTNGPRVGQGTLARIDLARTSGPRRPPDNSCQLNFAPCAAQIPTPRRTTDKMCSLRPRRDPLEQPSRAVRWSGLAIARMFVSVERRYELENLRRSICMPQLGACALGREAAMALVRNAKTLPLHIWRLRGGTLPLRDDRDL